MKNGRGQIPSETYTLMGLGLAAVVLVWLVFSVMRKVFGLVLIAVLLIGGWMLWNDPELLQNVSAQLARLWNG